MSLTESGETQERCRRVRNREQHTGEGSKDVKSGSRCEGGQARTTSAGAGSGEPGARKGIREADRRRTPAQKSDVKQRGAKQKGV